MNDKLTAEEKLRIIDLLAVSQSKEELRQAINNYLLSSENKEEILPPKEEITKEESIEEPTENIEKEMVVNQKETLSSEPNKASIYDSKYLSLVSQDRETHPRDEVLTMDIPTEQTNELTSTFDKEIASSKEEDKEEKPQENIYPEEASYYPEEPKVLEKKLNNPWADSGARTVSPGELNL